ncbi:MAG: hypothetical protein HYY02_07350 [Chloroflexi bacterium]|nr:hypothetical protein [Chloroflexota bacterium]
MATKRAPKQPERSFTEANTSRMPKDAVRALTMRLDEIYRQRRSGRVDPLEEVDPWLFTYAA